MDKIIQIIPPHLIHEFLTSNSQYTANYGPNFAQKNDPNSKNDQNSNTQDLIPEICDNLIPYLSQTTHHRSEI